VCDPEGIMNPWKLFPTPISYSEVLMAGRGNSPRPEVGR
jgi:hypothetical protein